MALAIAAIVALVLGMFGDVLFMPGDKVPSSNQYDIFNYFASSRALGFAEMAKGHLLLWNPYLFGGTPFLGNFQSALLYPFNIIYMILPLAKAISADIALHFILLGLLVYAWARSRKISALGSFFAAALAAFSSGFFLRVFAGHLTMISAFAWTPLVLLSVEKIIEKPRAKWILAGILAATMKLLAGLPQMAFNTALCAGIYALVRMPRRDQRATKSAALLTVALMPILLAAFQLGPGIQAAEESTRSGGTQFDYASSYSFPPENFIQLLVPGFFGDHINSLYWGGWKHFWEAFCHIGITGIVLALIGSMFGEPRARRHCILMISILIILALGRYTPVYHWVYSWIPGADHFKAPNRFLNHAALFAALLAGAGIDAICRQPKRAYMAVAIVLCIMGGLVLLSVWGENDIKDFSPANGWSALAGHIFKSYPVFWTPESLSYGKLAEFAVHGVHVALLISAVLLVLLILSLRLRWALYPLILLGIFEVYMFDASHRGSFHLSEMAEPELASFYASHPGDYRVLDVPACGNRVLLFNRNGALGYDPLRQARYEELATKAHMMEWPVASARAQLLMNPILPMLRCQFLLPERHFKHPVEIPNPLPRFLLISAYRVLTDSNALLATLADPSV